MNNVTSTLSQEPQNPDSIDNGLRILYRNYLGVLSWRTIIPTQGSLETAKNNPYHKEGDWVFQGWDLGKRAFRVFSMSRVYFCVNAKETLSKEMEATIFKEVEARYKAIEALGTQHGNESQPPNRG